MPQPTKGPRLGGSPAHQKLMLANLATSLFTHGRIHTTRAKAERLRPYAERLITKAKRGDLHNTRVIAQQIRDKDVIHRLVAEIGPFFADRPGGYTRIIKTLPRRGDNAPMAIIELVNERTASAEAGQATRVASQEPSSSPTGAVAVSAIEDEGVAAPTDGDTIDTTSEDAAVAEQDAGDESGEPEAPGAIAVSGTSEGSASSDTSEDGGPSATTGGSDRS